MTNGPTDKVVRCPECGADNKARLAKCWLCGADLAAGVAARDSAGPGTADAPPQFGLSSLFLIVTLACVCLGLISIAPGLIVPLLVIVVPALIRTLSASQRWMGRGAPMTVVDKFAAFFISVGIVILIGVAGVIAFLAACLIGAGVLAVAPPRPEPPQTGAWIPSNIETLVLVLFTGIGGIAALAVMAWLFIWTWPKKQ